MRSRHRRHNVTALAWWEENEVKVLICFHIMIHVFRWSMEDLIILQLTQRVVYIAI